MRAASRVKLLVSAPAGPKLANHCMLLLLVPVNQDWKGTETSQVHLYEKRAELGLLAGSTVASRRPNALWYQKQNSTR